MIFTDLADSICIIVLTMVITWFLLAWPARFSLPRRALIAAILVALASGYGTLMFLFGSPFPALAPWALVVLLFLLALFFGAFEVAMVRRQKRAAQLRAGADEGPA